MMGAPLQYQSLKVVLQHTDANVRFRISLHMPSIRQVEKNVPLKIDRLQMTEMITEVNDIEYKVEVVRRYPGRRIPWMIKKEERLNDRPWDYDKFGFLGTPDRNSLLPGDISFYRGHQIGRRFDTEEDERRIREALRVTKKALERLPELKSKGMTVEGYLLTLEPTPAENDEENKIRQTLKHFSQQLPLHIEEYEFQLLPFDCRRNNTKPPFACYIQLKITDGENTHIEIFEYTKKLFEASKHLHEVLFGRRTECIRVRNLDLNSIHPGNEILRLPPSFRMRVHKADVRAHQVSHKSFPLLVENSNSLDSLRIERWEMDHFRCPAVRNAKRLVMTDLVVRDVEDMVPVITELPNLEMSILPLTMWFEAEHYFQIIQAWLARERPVGASCWMKINGDDTKIAEDVLKMVGAAHERTEITESFVTIHNSGSTKIEVFYDEFMEPTEYEDFCTWIMKTRVVKV